MQHSPPEIKDKLLRALDNEYHVVDMGAVLEIISILERTPITKEALESTRLGKHINEFRRKTDNESLAKRAKDLVRRWRDMIMPTPATASSTPPSESASVNGSSNAVSGPGPGGTKYCRSNLTSPAISTASSSSPGLSIRKVPSLPPSPTASVRRAAPNSEAVARTHANNKRLRKEEDRDEGSPPLKRRATPNGVYYKDHIEDHFSYSASSLVPIVDSTCESVSKSASSNIQALVQNYTDIVKTKMAQIGRSAKVKTTQELLDDLKARGGSPPTTPNCPPSTSKEENETNSRHRALNFLLAPRSPDEVSRNKSEHMAKFLSSQPEEGKSSYSPCPPGSPTSREVSDILSALPPLDVNSIVWSDKEDEEPKEKKARTQESLLEAVLSGEQLEGVTGNFEETDDNRTEFREWHEPVWRTASDGHKLLVWPYVIID